MAYSLRLAKPIPNFPTSLSHATLQAFLQLSYFCAMDFSTLPGNKYDRETLRKRLEAEPFERRTLSFYKYAIIENVVEFRNSLFRAWEGFGVLGRTYVSSEGINGQISVPEPAFEAFRTHLYSYPFLDGIRLNLAVEDQKEAFLKLIVRIRPKIVSDGLPEHFFDVTQPGPHLKAKAFNELLDREDSVVVDMRNHYESEVGHFEGAICPDVDTFRDSLPLVERMLEQHKQKPVLLYCTGGIRCEKASAYLRHKGFEQVYQLEGGIIEYTRQAKAEGLPVKFIGKNFVFDERMGERISDDVIATCHQCGAPCDDHTNCANEACHMLFIQCPNCKESFEGCCTEDCQNELKLPLAERKLKRKGKTARVTYEKARLRPKPDLAAS